ncbi:DUF2330 domain-containing protein [Enemella dayhoffiae]|nr:DUF2330 domain-containing protein [Enemella dayhoffiae]
MFVRRFAARLVAGLLIVLFVAGGQVAVAPTAPACACGAAPTRENQRVTGETALITWDGRTETIDLIMRLGGRASEAAWIMPTPAGTELSLGSNKVWPGLDVAIAPRPVKVADWTPRFDWLTGGDARSGGAPPGSGARVERVVDIGPFRVTTLVGDAGSVNRWLAENRYPVRPELVPTFQGYLDQGWRIQAVRLVPEQAGGMFQESLPPLRLRFDTDRVSYPIRLSRHAGGKQRVALYLAAPHRMAITTDAAPGQPLQLMYAGWQPGRLIERPEGFTGDGRIFLTAWSGNVDPDAFVADYAFARAPDDSEFFRTYPVMDRTPGRILGLLIVVVPVVLLGVGVIVAWLLIRRRG